MNRNAGCWWILYLPAIGLLLLVLPQIRGHYTFYPAEWLIQAAGMLTWMFLIGRGMAWVESKMSRDVDAYTMADRFSTIYKDVATPLETQEEDEDAS